jgi:hypothetical protein
VEVNMLGRYATLFVAVAGVTLAASQAQAETNFSFLNKYIEKYAKVKEGNKIAGFDLDKVTNRLDSMKSKSGKNSRLSSLKNRFLGNKAATTSAAPVSTAPVSTLK